MVGDTLSGLTGLSVWKRKRQISVCRDDKNSDFMKIEQIMQDIFIMIYHYLQQYIS